MSALQKTEQYQERPEGTSADTGADSRDGVKTPKCFRQMGHPDPERTVYMEDYVYSYLLRYSQEHAEEGCFLPVFGRGEPVAGDRLYIDGAAAFDLEQGDITSRSAREIYASMEPVRQQYFPDWECKGWLLRLSEHSVGEHEIYESIAKKWFRGSPLLILCHDLYDNTLTSYTYGADGWTRLGGYFIYYDKNVPMQEYIAEHQWNVLETVKDPAAELVRSRFREPAVREQETAAGWKSFAGQLATRQGKGLYWMLLLLMLLVGIFLSVNRNELGHVTEALWEYTGKLAGNGK